MLMVAGLVVILLGRQGPVGLPLLLLLLPLMSPLVLLELSGEELPQEEEPRQGVLGPSRPLSAGLVASTAAETGRGLEPVLVAVAGVDVVMRALRLVAGCLMGFVAAVDLAGL